MTKDELKNKILKSKINITKIITEGIVQRKPKQKILREAKAELSVLARKHGLSADVYNSLWLDVLREYDTVSKKSALGLRKVGKDNTEARAEVVAGTVQKQIIDTRQLIRERNRAADRTEFLMKHELVWGEHGYLKTVQAKPSGYSPFFLCSTHINPAKDHKDWEGKMYYDADYPQYVTSEQDLARIGAYIRNRNLRSVQDIVSGPVFLITRKNCRHYFINIPIPEAMRSGVKTLLRKHGMYMKDDPEMSYEERCLDNIRTKLQEERELYKIAPNSKLLGQIKSDSRLMSRWERAVRKSTMRPAQDTARLMKLMNRKRRR